MISTNLYIVPVMDFNKIGFLRYDEDMILYNEGIIEDEPLIDEYIFRGEDGDFLRTGYVTEYAGEILYSETQSELVKFALSRNTKEKEELN